MYEQNLPTKYRPQEVSMWIKSKKKDVVPSVKHGLYRKRFVAWWNSLQLSWRNGGKSLGRSAPLGETWEGLRKCGTAGIYLIIIEVSWWIKAQGLERDDDAWLAVEDILWAIGEMMNIVTPPAVMLMKCGSEEKENEARHKKV
jgi:hypothetical protein